MMINTPGLPGLDLDGATSLRGTKVMGIAGLGQIDIRRWLEMRGMASLSGLGASRYESHPEVLTKAKSLLQAAGFSADCFEQWVSVDPQGAGYYLRSCIAKCPGGQVTERFDADMTIESPEVTVVGINTACRNYAQDATYGPGQTEYSGTTSSTGWAGSDTASRTGTRSTTSGTQSGSGSPVSLIDAPAGTRDATRQSAPSGSPANQGTQPGEVPAELPASTGQRMAEGAGDRANESGSESESFFSSSIDISGVKIPVVLLLGAGLLLAFGMGGAKKE